MRIAGDISKNYFETQKLCKNQQAHSSISFNLSIKKFFKIFYQYLFTIASDILLRSVVSSLKSFAKASPWQKLNCKQHGLAELLAGFKSDDARSIMVAGRLHMTRNRTRCLLGHVATGGWRLEECKLNSQPPSSLRSTEICWWVNP